GGASQDSLSGSFRFVSYRDPRLEETLADFDQSLIWLLESPPTAEEIEQAILGVISSIDKPGSPAGEAQQTFQAELFDRSRELREQFRRRVLTVTYEDLTRVTTRYLKPATASMAIITGPGHKEQLAKQGLAIKTLQ
ncbi:MAG TPA: peptidase M16, partial [Marinobacter sp.]|nr:peptidase M16 [Marinobacter sp.]